jgi:hypothetical protein
MNGTWTATPANFINAESAAPRPPFLVPPFRVLDEDELDAVWLDVRRQGRRDAAVYDDLARELTLDELAEAAIGTAVARELGFAPELAAAQRRRLFFEYLEALLSHVPR